MKDGRSPAVAASARGKPPARRSCRVVHDEPAPQRSAASVVDAQPELELVELIAELIARRMHVFGLGDEPDVHGWVEVIE